MVFVSQEKSCEVKIEQRISSLLQIKVRITDKFKQIITTPVKFQKCCIAFLCLFIVSNHQTAQPGEFLFGCLPDVVPLESHGQLNVTHGQEPRRHAAA